MTSPDPISPEQASPDQVTDDWCAAHFDHLSPIVGEHLHEVMERMRDRCPVTHSDASGGFWAVSRYDDVVRVAQDWESFSSEGGITVPAAESPLPAVPEMVDPPLHREFKRLINAYFSPKAVGEHEQGARELVTRLIDDFIDDGECEFMDAFARPLPGMMFFDCFLHAPAEDLDHINRLATTASIPGTRESHDARRELVGWISQFVERRRQEPERGDVVDAVLNAEIEGRPITEKEIIGVIMLLVFGGLDTTAGALGQMMIRFCREPHIPERLREQPERIPEAVEELLRLDGSFAFIARLATRDAEVGGHTIAAGESVLLSWVSANRDEAEFDRPAEFDLDRPSNRHLAFGAGPHRCAGSHLARMNLRIALEELLSRLGDLRLQDGAEPIPYHSGYNRAPEVVPITFTAIDR